MAMQMQRAFNARMLSKMTRYTVSPGSYDAENVWVEGATASNIIYGVIKAGNKFSQFEEGQAIHAEDGGARYSDYRALYVIKKFSLELEDKIDFNGIYFNVLQRSDEEVFGFYSYILEKSKVWSPS